MAAALDLCAFGNRGLNELVDVLLLVLVDHRAHVEVAGQRVTVGHALHLLDDLGDEFVVDALLHVDTLGGVADLAGVDDAGRDDVVDRLVELAVGGVVGDVVFWHGGSCVQICQKGNTARAPRAAWLPKHYT